jgi:hypothetical protein
LAQVRETVLAVRSNEARLGALEANPQFSASARLVTGGGPQQVLLWVALIVVVGALSVVTLRMVRQQPVEPGGRPGPASEGPASGGPASQGRASEGPAQAQPASPLGQPRSPDGGESSSQG